MTTLGWRLVEFLALQLAPAEREAVLGDLIEMQTNQWQGMSEIVGLIARRQLQLLRSWRAWLAAPGLAFPCSLMLMGFSFAISMEIRDHFWGGSLSYFPSGKWEALSIVCQIVVLVICSWTAGFIVESLSSGTFALSALCSLLACLFCLLRYHEAIPRFCLLLFLLPAIGGVRFSTRGGTIRRRSAVTLAIVGTISMAVLAARGNFWLLNWELVGPAWYLVVRPNRSEPIRN